MNTDNKYQGMWKGFVTVTTLFFMWGFITVSIDPLIAALKAIFELNYAEAMLTQFAFFMAYFVVSLPAAALIARLGNSKSIMFALAVMVVGCLVVPLATKFETYALVLVALFIIASGITILQVVANPLAAALGRLRQAGRGEHLTGELGGRAQRAPAHRLPPSARSDCARPTATATTRCTPWTGSTSTSTPAGSPR